MPAQIIMSKIPADLTHTTDFPSPELALDNPNGLLAFGGDLSQKRLIQAYQKGIFPWYSDDEPILWWSPNPRAVLFLDDFKVNRSFKKTLNKNPYTIFIDTHFETVINHCQKRNPNREQADTWITPEMKMAYIDLFNSGYAHCVACFEGDQFVGGLYGVGLGKLFFGESMVSLKPDASKIGLYYLMKLLKLWEFEFIDCQVPNDHLINLGAKLIPRSQFLQRLKHNNTYPLLNPCWAGFKLLK